MIKRFFFVLATLALILGTAQPAFALTADHLVMVRGRLAFVVIQESWPPKAVITGALPSFCYVARRAVYVNQAERTISVIVLAAPVATFAACNPTRARPGQFTMSVTLDPIKLGLRRGKYVVLFNPVNGKSSFLTTLTVR